MKNAEAAVSSLRGRVKSLRTGGLRHFRTGGVTFARGGGGVSTPLHAMYILGAHNSKRKLFYIANPSAYYFYVKTIISVDFQIFISVYTIDILYCIWNFFLKI